MSIPSVGTPGTSYTPDATVNLQTTAKATEDALVSMDPKKVMESLVALQKVLDATPSQSSGGLTNSNGAPSIGGVTLAFSPEDMAAALLALQGKTQDQQMKNANQGILIDQQKMADNNTKQLAKITDWITKCAEAAEKAKAATASGWFSKIFSFVAAVVSVIVAVVATVATGGAAAPLLAMAVIGAVTAGISLGNQIRATQDPPQAPIDSFSTAMGKLMTNMLVECGVPKEDAEKIGPLMSGLGALLLCPAMLVIDPAFAGQAAGGIARLSGATDTQIAIVEGTFTAAAALTTAVVMMVATGGAASGQVVGTMAKVLDISSKVGGVMSTVLAVGSGAAAIASGIATIEQGHLQKDADGKLVDKKKLDAMMLDMQASMEQAKDDLKKLLDEIQNGMATVSAMISAGGESRAQIATNMGGQRI